MGLRLTMYFTCAVVSLKSLCNFGLVRMLDLKPIKWLCVSAATVISTPTTSAAAFASSAVSATAASSPSAHISNLTARGIL